MMSAVRRIPVFAAVVLCLSVSGGAQERPAPASSNDPRVGLKPGVKNAGEAARNMELIATLPKPPGFFDPKNPAGEPTEPEAPPKPEPPPGTPAPAATTAT